MFGFNKSLGDSNELINYIISNDFYNLKNLIESRRYSDKELHTIQNNYNQNLLHISVLVENQQMVSYFLEKGVSYTNQDKYKKSAWDQAVLSKNSNILEIFVAFRAKKENTNAVKLAELTSENESLQTKYSLRNRDITVLQIENTSLKTSNKRLRDEICDLQFNNKKLVDEVSNLNISNKKLREENIVLVNKNEKLKTSVETLMNNTKK